MIVQIIMGIILIGYLASYGAIRLIEELTIYGEKEIKKDD